MSFSLANALAQGNLNAAIQTPAYERSQLVARIVHIGFSAFFRVHQARYLDQLCRLGGNDWGYCVMSLFSEGASIQQLRAQDHLYSLTEYAPDALRRSVVGVINESYHPALDGVEVVLARLAAPETAIITLTVTEKGYCLIPGSGALDAQHPQIQQDLENPQQPSSVIGYLVAALRLRRQVGLGGLSILSCDNIAANGDKLRGAVLQFAQHLEGDDSDLQAWIATQVSFPNSMVDRIAPAMTAANYQETAEALRVADPCAVQSEAFQQWVIEDHFVAGRPAWERVGVQLVEDVRPFETMKLRLLNGSHSFLAYLGYLGGYSTISDALNNPAYRRATRRLMRNEQIPSLEQAPEGVDLEDYAEQLLARFANPHLQHRTAQIATDGSQKLPQRFLQPAQALLTKGQSLSYLALGIAAWMRYMAGVDENGETFAVNDPMAAQCQAIYAEHGLSVTAAEALLDLESIFAPSLAANTDFRYAVCTRYQQLLQHGARA